MNCDTDLIIGQKILINDQGKRYTSGRRRSRTPEEILQKLCQWKYIRILKEEVELQEDVQINSMDYMEATSGLLHR